LATAPVISNYNTTVIGNPTGTPWSVATITTSTVTNPNTGYSANVEQVLFQLTPTGSPTYQGAIQADYVVGANGTLAPVDQVFYQANGNITETYYGTEANNPYYAASGVAPVDPGYAYTQYSYVGGVLSQVVAVETNGKTFIGV
jgi:hypothetical protein